MSRDTDLPTAEKVLDALGLCGNPVTINQIETLSGCRDVTEVIEYLVKKKIVVVSAHRIVNSGGKTSEEMRYQIRM